MIFNIANPTPAMQRYRADRSDLQADPISNLSIGTDEHTAFWTSYFNGLECRIDKIGHGFAKRILMRPPIHQNGKTTSAIKNAIGATNAEMMPMKIQIPVAINEARISRNSIHSLLIIWMFWLAASTHHDNQI
jgi:hypothetical protein